jgi:tRNA-splicing ligase RtcB
MKKISKYEFEIPKEGKMIVPGLIFASEKLLKNIEKDGKTVQQVKNVASLPGIVYKSLAMPDAHQGYGFPIGGVAAFDSEKGIISPGGIGFDINCGIRLIKTNISKSDFMKKRIEILNELHKNVPSGVGKDSEFRLSESELNEVLDLGIKWALKKGYALKEDVECIEDYGFLDGDSSKISQKAKSRGKNQLGSLGSGNHFLEIQEIESIYDKEKAKTLGLNHGDIAIMVHCGSRGLGHQTASDYILKMEKEYGFSKVSDRQLVNAPIKSELGKDYIKAMNSAANFAFVNRQLITHQIRKSFKKYFPKSELKLVYDICHNIAKFESHKFGGKECSLCIHRKGATRSFGPGRTEIPEKYRKIGCPIFIPGSMGTFSYVLIGTKKAEEISLGSTAHGAGRVLSRSFAIKNISPDKLKDELKKSDVMLKANSIKGAIEEAPEAYKDVNEVARVSHELGIGQLVARLKPLAVVKG